MFRLLGKLTSNTFSTPTKTDFCFLWASSSLSWLRLSALCISGYYRSTIWWRKEKATQLSSGWRIFGWDLDFLSSPILCSHLWSFFTERGCSELEWVNSQKHDPRTSQESFFLLRHHSHRPTQQQVLQWPWGSWQQFVLHPHWLFARPNRGFLIYWEYFLNKPLLLDSRHFQHSLRDLFFHLLQGRYHSD